MEYGCDLGILRGSLVLLCLMTNEQTIAPTISQKGQGNQECRSLWDEGLCHSTSYGCVAAEWVCGAPHSPCWWSCVLHVFDLRHVTELISPSTV